MRAPSRATAGPELPRRHHVVAGEFDDAQRSSKRQYTIAAITGNAPGRTSPSCWRPGAATPVALVSHDPDSDSQDMLSVNREFADAVLHNGLGSTPSERRLTGGSPRRPRIRVLGSARTH
jgi:hypothetical protein